MIENIVVSKKGSESDDRKTFSLSHTWEPSGSNLIVYLNDKIKDRELDYSIVNEYTISFNSSLKNTDTVRFVITKFEDPSGNTSLDSRISDLDRLSKLSHGKTQTSIHKRSDEENIVSQQIITASQIWIDEISEDPEQAQEDGVAKFYSKLQLQEDITVANHKGWYASESELMENRILEWIDPRFGRLYNVRLYDNNDTEIPSSDPMDWNWDYYSGYLTIQNDFEYVRPFYISGYQYVGEKALDQLATWKEPVFSTKFLPYYHNDDGDIRLVLTENVFYRWDSIANMWRELNYGSDTLKNPVVSKDGLPSVNNQRGDLRLVMEDNDLYVFDDTRGDEGEWIIITGYSFSPENYYDKSYLDEVLDDKADANHIHDTIYYRKTEVDSLVRWRPSRESYTDLPPYTENRDGDVILTRDTNTIYRWVEENPNEGQGHWTAIVESNFTWKGPVEVYDNLPYGSNNPGDVRLVKEEEKPYWWDGVKWTEMKATVADHDHDDRYVLKSDLNWKPPVDTLSDMPTVDNDEGDIRLVLDTNYIYRWDVNLYKWIALDQASSWRDPVPALSDLPLTNNTNNDVIFVKETSKIYYWGENTSTWNPIENKDHDHDDRYYTRQEVDDFFSSDGHTHNGIDSPQVDYNDLLNIPYFSWGMPTLNKADLPLSGNEPGDARIVLNDRSLYVWTGSTWYLIATGMFKADHDHDDRYYTIDDVDSILSSEISSLTAQIASLANRNHDHDDRYYQKNEVEDFFDVQSGHNHDGINSRRINYFDLENIPDPADHTHHDLYYTKDQLRNPGGSSVHFENIVDMPGFTSSWRSPVQTLTNLPTENNQTGDLRIVLDDKHIYEWDGADWNFVGNWEVASTSYWKDPVQLKSDLPSTNNMEGDVRLVLSTNLFYRWNDVEQEWKVIKASVSGGSGGVSLEDSLVMVFVNGINLQEGEEWKVKDAASIELLIDTEDEDKVSVVVYDQNNRFYKRFDFSSFSFQQEFTIGSEQSYRQETTLTENQTVVNLASPHTVGSGDMFVWWNGLLQKVDEDYFETSSTQIELVDPAEEGDMLIILIFDSTGTNTLYTREDQFADQSQKIFQLEYQYQTGKNHLLLFLNGQLQKVGDDYREIDNETIEMYDSLDGGEKLTFLTFNATLSVGESDIQSACDVKLGTPPDGTWSDGLFSWNSETPSCKAFDDINEALVGIVTNKPSNIEDTELLCMDSRFEGRISQGNTNIEDSSGIMKDYLTEDGEFYLYTANSSFLGIDEGVVRLYINNSMVDSFNLKTAFVEAHRSLESGQQKGKYGVEASGAYGDVGLPSVDGLRNSDNELITVMEISKYETNNDWQFGKIRINIKPEVLRDGYNEIYIVHQVVENSYTTKVYKFFFDNSQNEPISDVLDITEDTLNSSRYLSGVRYYSIGDNFEFGAEISNLFDNTYIDSPVKLSFPGLGPIDIEIGDLAGLSSPPAIGDIALYENNLILDAYDEYSIDAQVELTISNSFNEYVSHTANKNILVNTYSQNSTNKIEPFFDERYRLPAGGYDNIPSQITGQWGSSSPLGDDEALIFDQQLQYANLNFQDFLPSQSVDYSSNVEDQWYYRAFKDIEAHNNGLILLEGINKENLLSNKIIVDIKLPSQTGWLSLNKKYDPSSFEGDDGDGCLVNVDGEVFYYTSGTYSTIYSNRMIIMRFCLNSSSPSIGRIEVWNEI